MKDKRIISVKTPQMQKIRNGMRMLLIRASQSEGRKIHEELEQMRFDSEENRITVDDMTPTELKLYRELQGLENENREVIRSSICMCHSCGIADRDIYYNYPYRVWYCVDCVDFFKSAHAKMETKKARGDYMCDPDDEFGQSFY